MRFPRALEKNGRNKLSAKKILPFHCMYTRHKADIHWKKGNEFPDFNQIKVDQSFNWSAFSYPVWTRFDPNKQYMANYGIMSYKVWTIKNIHKFSKILPENSFGVKHEPEDINYSHCELYPINIEVEHKKRDRENRREFRHILARNWKKKLEPFEEPNQIENFRYFIVYITHKASLFISHLFNRK